MRIKQLIDEDFVNYKKVSMFIGTCTCNWKCCMEQGLDISVCQNSELAKSKTIDMPTDKLISRYINNSITHAVVFGGLEPMLQFDELLDFIKQFREISDDDVVIYTGFTEQEITEQIKILSQYSNIYIKMGRYIPNQKPHRDKILDVDLASDNQYAIRIS